MTANMSAKTKIITNRESCPAFNKFYRVTKCFWYVDNYTGKNDQRNAVANPFFRHLLTQPHNKSSTGSQSNNGHNTKTPTRGGNNELSGRSAHAFKAYGNTQALNNAENNSTISCILYYFFTTRLTFFGELFNCRDYNCQELKNNRR